MTIVAQYVIFIIERLSKRFYLQLKKKKPFFRPQWFVIRQRCQHIKIYNRRRHLNTYKTRAKFPNSSSSSSSIPFSLVFWPL